MPTVLAARLLRHLLAHTDRLVHSAPRVATPLIPVRSSAPRAAAQLSDPYSKSVIPLQVDPGL